MSEIQVDQKVFEDITSSLNTLESEINELRQKVRSDLGGSGSTGNINRHLNDTGKAIAGLGAKVDDLSDQSNDAKENITDVQKHVSALTVDVNGDGEYIKPLREIARDTMSLIESMQKSIDSLKSAVDGDGDTQEPLRKMALRFEAYMVKGQILGNWLQAGLSLVLALLGWFMSSQIYGRFEAIETQQKDGINSQNKTERSLGELIQKSDRNQDEIDRLRSGD